jgi:hypothetical protein
MELSQYGKCFGKNVLIGDINEENRINITGGKSFLRDLKPSGIHISPKIQDIIRMT